MCLDIGILASLCEACFEVELAWYVEWRWLNEGREIRDSKTQPQLLPGEESLWSGILLMI
jgi:hypothetical protein